MSQLDRFISELDRDLAWRKKEVSSFLAMHNETNSELILKACILLLYSHWEGFVKNASKRYLYFISKKKLDVEVLTNNFKAIRLKGFARNVQDSRNTLTLSNELKLIAMIAGNERKKFVLPSGFLSENDSENIIDTAGNLNYEIFRNISNILGVGEKYCIKTKSHYIDVALLKNRNKIAHGNKVGSSYCGEDDFDFSERRFSQLKELIFTLINNVSDDLKSYAEYGFFLEAKAAERELYAIESSLSLEKELKAIFE